MSNQKTINKARTNQSNRKLPTVSPQQTKKEHNKGAVQIQPELTAAHKRKSQAALPTRNPLDVRFGANRKVHKGGQKGNAMR